MRQEHRALSVSAPPPARAPEDPFLTAPHKASSEPTLARGDHCRPGGPDGEGQAIRGQARQARGEPPSGTYRKDGAYRDRLAIIVTLFSKFFEQYL